MLSFLVMIGLSLSLTGYGYVALFKKEWLMKLRAFSAQVEGKEKNELTNTLSQARKIMAILALVLGVVGLIITIASIFVYFQVQSGAVSI